MNYTIHDQEGIILRSGFCPDSMLETIKQHLKSGESIIEGSSNDSKDMVVNGKILPMTVKEIEDKLCVTRKERKPDFSTVCLSSDTELNKVIHDFYFGRVNVENWRKENYSTLRKLCYPDITIFADAQIKLSSLNPDVIKEGQEQLDKYLADSLAVKERFPKPVV